MKKSIILLAFVLGAFTANAQSVVEGTKFTDNWSVEVNAGAITPLTHSAFFKSMRPAFGVGFSKQLTPIFGLGFQGMEICSFPKACSIIKGNGTCSRHLLFSQSLSLPALPLLSGGNQTGFR